MRVSKTPFLNRRVPTTANTYEIASRQEYRLSIDIERLLTSHQEFNTQTNRQLIITLAILVSQPMKQESVNRFHKETGVVPQSQPGLNAKPVAHRHATAIVTGIDELEQAKFVASYQINASRRLPVITSGKAERID